MTFQSHASRDLFRRPTGIKTTAHGGHDVRIPDQLAMHRAAVFISILGNHSMIAVQYRDLLVAIVVSPDLSVDCRGRATQVVGDLFDGYLRFKPFSQLATFFEVQVRVAMSL